MLAWRSAHFSERSEPDARDVDYAKGVLFVPRAAPTPGR